MNTLFFVRGFGLITIGARLMAIEEIIVSTRIGFSHVVAVEMRILFKQVHQMVLSGTTER
jgi:hypothetical protein